MESTEISPHKETWGVSESAKVTRPITPEAPWMTQNPDVDLFKQLAEMKKLKPVTEGDWLVLDGGAYEQDGTPTKFPYINERSAVAQSRGKTLGHYSLANGFITFINPATGEQLLGYQTKANEEALEKAGYFQASSALAVPFGDLSHEKPTGELGDAFTPLVERGRETVKQEVDRENLQLYAAEAAHKEIHPLKSQDPFVRVDGVEFTTSDKEPGSIELNTDGHLPPYGRILQVGTFAVKGKVLSYVDGEGKVWVGAATEDNKKILNEAGYKVREGALASSPVPFSSGETPTDAEKATQISQVLGS